VQTAGILCIKRDRCDMPMGTTINSTSHTHASSSCGSRGVTAAAAAEFGEITQNNSHYAVEGHSRSDFGTNRKFICDFLFVINTNLPPVLHHFRDIAFDRCKIALFGYPSCV